VCTQKQLVTSAKQKYWGKFVDIPDLRLGPPRLAFVTQVKNHCYISTAFCLFPTMSDVYTILSTVLSLPLRAENGSMGHRKLTGHMSHGSEGVYSL